MRLLPIIALVLLTGCDLAHFNTENPKLEIQSEAMHFETKSGTIQTPVNIAKVVDMPEGLLKLTVTSSGNVAKGAVEINNPAANFNTTLNTAAHTVDVQFLKELISVITNVPEGAIKVNLSVNFATGSVVVKGATVDPAFNISPWSMGLIGLMLFGFLAYRSWRHEQQLHEHAQVIQAQKANM